MDRQSTYQKSLHITDQKSLHIKIASFIVDYRSRHSQQDALQEERAAAEAAKEGSTTPRRLHLCHYERLYDPYISRGTKALSSLVKLSARPQSLLNIIPTKPKNCFKKSRQFCCRLKRRKLLRMWRCLSVRNLPYHATRAKIPHQITLPIIDIPA